MLAEQKEMKTDNLFLSHFFLVLGEMVTGTMLAGWLGNDVG